VDTCVIHWILKFKDSDTCICIYVPLSGRAVLGRAEQMSNFECEIVNLIEMAD